MINPKRDRFDYCGFLKPDRGFSVSKAICLTYSLDFVSLISVAFSLAVNEAAEEQYREGKIPASQVVEILSNFKNKLYVYSDKGQIKKPTKNNGVISLFDSCIKQYNCSTQKSFHPKLILVEYVSKKKEYHYKLIVSSRNLAVSADWDFGACLQSELKDYDKNKTANKRFNSSLCELLKALNKKDFKDLIERINYSQFYCAIEQTPKIWDVYNTLGEENKKAFDKYAQRIITSHEKKRTLLISPFIKSGAIEKIYNSTHDSLIIVTRTESLKEISEKIFNDKKVKVYTISNDYLLDDEDDGLSGDLHAKIYLVEKTHTTSLYFGSANCTNSGLCLNEGETNVESLICFDKGSGFFDAFVDELFAEKLNIFKIVEKATYELEKNKEEEKDESFDAISIIKAIALNKFEGQYDKDTKTIVLKSVEKVNIGDFKVFITHLSQPNDNQYQALDFGKKLIFTNIALKEASNFFLIKVVGKKPYERVVIANIKGLADRDQELLNSFVVTYNDALSYLMFLMTGIDDYEAYSIDTSFTNRGRAGDTALYGSVELPLYERALELSYKNPDIMKTIAKKYQKLPENVKENEKLQKFIELFVEKRQ